MELDFHHPKGIPCRIKSLEYWDAFVSLGTSRELIGKQAHEAMEQDMSLAYSREIIWTSRRIQFPINLGMVASMRKLSDVVISMQWGGVH